ncbi:phosphoglycolate phosphatase [Azospirillum sp. SYSU D00513]|uniref:phosphoglycolate phosphatase n=1 Tax=Azospirillum sp. SYSU D00513 TaxID=2812561 RepID=UPI001A9594DE|nr:phosphoglycolate phosphatase [Azospirillum sp. SYSU D00513]
MRFPYSALVFDFDGTLIDSAPDITRALNRTLAQYGRPEVTVAQVRTMIGDGSAMLLRQAFAATGGELDAEAAKPVLANYMDVYFEEASQPSTPFPDVAETLGWFHGQGVKLGLCTNKPEKITRKLLGLLGLDHLFSAVAGGDTLPVRKPDGRHPGWVLEQLGVDLAAGHRAAMIGDNAHDVKAARSAGIPVIAMSYGYPRMPLDQLGADLIVDRFADLPDALRRLAG